MNHTLFSFFVSFFIHFCNAAPTPAFAVAEINFIFLPLLFRFKFKCELNNFLTKPLTFYSHIPTFAKKWANRFRTLVHHFVHPPAPISRPQTACL